MSDDEEIIEPTTDTNEEDDEGKEQATDLSNR